MCHLFYQYLFKERYEHYNWGHRALNNSIDNWSRIHVGCYQTSWSYMASKGHMCQCVELHWNNSRLHTNALRSPSPPPPQGRSCSQSGQDRGQSTFHNLHSVHQQCCSMVLTKKVVMACWLEVAYLRPLRYLPRCRPRRPACRRKIGSQISLRQPWSASKSRQEGLGVVAAVALQAPFFNCHSIVSFSTRDGGTVGWPQL